MIASTVWLVNLTEVLYLPGAADDAEELDCPDGPDGFACCFLFLDLVLVISMLVMLTDVEVICVRLI